MNPNLLRCLAIIVVMAASCGTQKPDSTRVPGSAETWMTTTLKGERIGYSVARRDRFEDGYRFEDVFRMELSMMGKSQKVRTRTVMRTGLDLTLESFSFRFESQDRLMDATGAVQGNELLVRIEGDRARAIKLDGEVYPMAALGRLVLDAEPGSELEFDVFDPATMDVNDVKVTVVGREQVEVGGKTYDALKVESKVSMFTITSWLDSAGMTLVEESPPGMRSERTTPEQAAEGVAGRASLDLLRMFRVEVDTAIPEPDRVSRAVYGLTGVLPGEFPLEWDNQRLLSEEPLRVEFSVPEVPGETPAVPLTEPAEFLGPTMTIQCDAPELTRRASEAVAGAGTALEVAEVLTDWVFLNVEKEPTASFPTALDVLKHMKGDCNEHSVLFAALARAAGLPAKVSVGLVYMEGAFYYHAWNEVLLGDVWMPVDATFGQFPAAALRLKLSEGEIGEQAKILGVVGRLGIEVESFETD